MVKMYFTIDPETGKWMAFEGQEYFGYFDAVLPHPVPVVEIDINLPDGILPGEHPEVVVLNRMIIELEITEKKISLKPNEVKK